MPGLPTPRDDLKRSTRDTIVVSCRHCLHRATLDPDKLYDAGFGDVPYIHLPLRCGECGRTGHNVSVYPQTNADGGYGPKYHETPPS